MGMAAGWMGKIPGAVDHTQCGGPPLYAAKAAAPFVPFDPFGPIRSGSPKERSL